VLNIFKQIDRYIKIVATKIAFRESGSEVLKLILYYTNAVIYTKHAYSFIFLQYTSQSLNG
jgi:hypothetical protein